MKNIRIMMGFKVLQLKGLHINVTLFRFISLCHRELTIQTGITIILCGYYFRKEITLLHNNVNNWILLYFRIVNIITH